MKSAVLQNEGSPASSPDRRVVFIIFTLSALCQLLVFWIMPVSMTADSPGYMAYASDLFSPSVGSQRTPGYPLLIAASGVHLFDSLVPLIFLQGIMSTLVPVLAYLTLSPVGRLYWDWSCFPLSSHGGRVKSHSMRRSSSRELRLLCWGCS